MFEKLHDSAYWKRIATVRCGSVLGWKVRCNDGKAYLFKGTKVRRCDWFLLCYALRKWIGWQGLLEMRP